MEMVKEVSTTCQTDHWNFPFDRLNRTIKFALSKYFSEQIEVLYDSIVPMFEEIASNEWVIGEFVDAPALEHIYVHPRRAEGPSIKR